MGFLHIWEVFYHCPQTFYIQVGCETDCAKSSVSSMGHVSMQHCIDKPRAYVCVQELMLITLKSVPKSPLLRVHIMCLVKNFSPNRYIASPSMCYVEGEAFALHTNAMPQHLFQTTALLQDKLSYIQSDSRAVNSVWHGHSHSKREVCIWEPHKWIIRLMPLISVPGSATQTCSLSHVL